MMDEKLNLIDKLKKKVVTMPYITNSPILYKIQKKKKSREDLFGWSLVPYLTSNNKEKTNERKDNFLYEH